MKNILISLLVLISAAMLISCSKKEEANSDQPRKKATKKFIVGFDADFPPYGFLDSNGEYAGFDLDLAAEVCRRKGWTLVKKPIVWAAKDAELSAGTITCIWNGFTITPERLDKYCWSKPYVSNIQYCLVKNESAIASLNDLTGKKVALQDGSSADGAFAAKVKELNLQPAEVKKVPDNNTAFTMLKTDAVDALALDSAVAKGFIAKNPDQYTILSDYLAIEQYGIGFALGNDALKDEVETTLIEMVKDGTVEKILTKWATEKADRGGDNINFTLQP